VAREASSKARHNSGRRQRWQLFTTYVVGAFVTLLAAAHFAQIRGVYWSEVQVVFLAPTSTVNPNVLQITPSSLIATAGIVAQTVDHSDSTVRVSSTAVTLAGEGIEKGYAVTLPNSGGQWANNYTQALLDVQVVGPTFAEVSQRLTQLVHEINQSLSTLQQDAGVAPVNLIRTQLSPPNPPVYIQSGSRMRAGIATVALGFGLTAVAASWLRRRGPWRRPDRRVDQTAQSTGSDAPAPVMASA
jgi:hypothetical protein